jgi:hypothetical protein
MKKGELDFEEDGDMAMRIKGTGTIHNGYFMVMAKKHPHARKKGYMMYHRLVMENYLGRCLKPREVVHHKDGDKLNNTISNLCLMDNVAHQLSHAADLPWRRNDISERRVRNLCLSGHSWREIGRRFSCSHNVIKRIVTGVSYGSCGR